MKKHILKRKRKSITKLNKEKSNLIENANNF